MLDPSRTTPEELALNKLLLSIISDKNKSIKNLWIALMASLATLVVLVGVLIYLILPCEKCVTTETTTTTTTVEQDTGEGSGNNVYQAGDNASYTQGGD